MSDPFTATPVSTTTGSGSFHGVPYSGYSVYFPQPSWGYGLELNNHFVQCNAPTVCGIEIIGQNGDNQFTTGQHTCNLVAPFQSTLYRVTVYWAVKVPQNMPITLNGFYIP